MDEREREREIRECSVDGVSAPVLSLPLSLKLCACVWVCICGATVERAGAESCHCQRETSAEHGVVRLAQGG